MSRLHVAAVIAAIGCAAGFAPAQQVEYGVSPGPRLANWTAPPYWAPSAPQPARGRPVGVAGGSHGVSIEAAPPTTILPLTAIAPCRLVDTRHSPHKDVGEPGGLTPPGYPRGQYGSGETRSYNLTTSTDCPSLPDNVGAWSLMFQFTTMGGSGAPSFLVAWPYSSAGGIGGQTTPAGDSTMLGYSDRWTADSAVVAAGDAGGGSINVYVQNAGDVIVEINGYYAPQSVVTTLNTLSGDVILSPGSNVDISPGGNTLTISMTGAPGGELPAGAAGQTLRSNGSGWVANGFLFNDGTRIGIGTTSPSEQLELTGNLRLPSTTGAVGQVRMGTKPLLHAYGGTSVFAGLDAGNLTMTGYQNAGVGSSALHAVTSGYHNVAVGQQALEGDTEGCANTAVGFWALKANQTADLNTACGSQSLQTNTTGAENTAVGASSLEANTVGAKNVGVGSAALAGNTTASRNTAVGQGALATQSYDGSAIAWDADNTAVGAGALTANQPTSAGNGNYNTAIGADSMTKNTTGWSNTAVGYASLWANTVGFSNTAVGANALNGTPAAASYNTAVGFDAGAGSSGGSNVLLGFGAGFSETGSNRLHIANSRDTTLIWGNFTAGAVVVNDTATVLSGAGLDVNGQIRARTWSGTGLASVCRDANGVLVPCTSDVRLRTNVVALSEEKDVMAVLARLRGVAFDWDRSKPQGANAGAGRELGFIAQEVEAVLPEIVHVEADGYRSLDYAKLTPLLVEVAKAQQAEIEALRARLAERDEELGRRLAAIEARMTAR